MADTQSILQLGIEAARAGEKAEARELFRLVTREDPNNTQGWLWLAGVAEHRDEKRTALERVLEIDPSNELARKGLNALGVTLPAAAASSAPPDPAATAKLEPAPTASTAQLSPAASSAPEQPAQPARRARVYDEPEVAYAPASSATAPATAAALGAGAAAGVAASQATAPAGAAATPRPARQETRRTVPAEEEVEPRRGGWGWLAFPLLLAALLLLAFFVWQRFYGAPDTTVAGASPGAAASGQAVDAGGSSAAGGLPAGSADASAAAPSEAAPSSEPVASAAPSAGPETSAAPSAGAETSAAPSPSAEASADASAAAPSEAAPSPSAQASAAASEPAAGASAEASAAAPSEPAPSPSAEASAAAPSVAPEPTTVPPTTPPEPTPEPPTAVPPTPVPEPTAAPPEPTPPGGDVAGANPAVVPVNTVVDAGDWSFSYGGISNFATGPFGGAPPSRGRFEIVLLTVRNNGGAPAQIPDGALVIKDGQGRVYDFNRAASVDYFNRFPDSGDLPADAPFPPNTLLSSVPLLFDVSSDASNLVLFSRDNLTQGFLIR